MADTGWLSAGTYSATFNAGNGPTVDVTNPGNAATDNGLNATWPFTGASQVGYGLRASNFDFSGIPSNAIIDGIEVRLGDYKSSSASTGCVWDEVRLIGTAGTMIGVDRSAGLPSINFIETAIAGAPDDLWGAWPILRSDLDDIDFGCVVSCVSGSGNPGNVDIDYLQIKVYYHVGLPAQVYPASQCAGHYPPMKTSGGKFYGLAVNGGNIRVYSATDPTATWTFEANQTTLSLGNITNSCLTCRMDSSNVIHIAWIENGGQSLKYVQFSTSTDTFGTVETVETLTASPNFVWCSMALRSDGDVILAYSGQTDKVMGGDKERVDYARREGGTWTAGLALDAAGDIHYGNPNCVLSANGNDDTHVVWQVTTNIADPPSSWQNLEARTIDSANNLSTALTGQTGDTSSHLRGHNNLVSFTFSSLNRIAGGGVDSISDGRIGIHGFEDGNGDLTSLSSIATTSGYAGFANGEVGVTSTARDPGTGGIYRVFSGGTTGNDADQDIHLEDDTDASPIGNNYLNQQELQDAVTCNFISAEVYTRGSATVVAYLYDDNGFQKYNEYQLAGPLTASGSPNVTGPTASGVANHELDADGTPIVTGPTASGTATLKKAASGTPTVTGPTASGAAKLKKIASGAATLVAVTAVGAAALAGGALTASGSPNITGPTASGQAGMLRQARGGGGTPTVVTRDYQAFPTAANSHSVSITGYTQGNLGIIAIVTNNDLGGGSSFTVPTGWTAIDNAPVSGANQGLRAIFVKVLGASETDPVVCAINPAANQQAEAVFIEVSDWEGTLSGVEVANRDFSTSHLASTETPPPLTVSWGAENNLWIIGVLVMDDPSTVTGWPAGYTTNGSFENNGAGQDVSALVGTSYRAAAVATETPGTVTLSESESVHGFTIGVRPAAATQVPTVTASGAATLGALTASGNPDVSGPTASGAASKIISASGSPNVSGPTASGQAGKLLTAANVGTFSYVGGGDDQGTTDTAQATHGQTIQSGDLVVAYLNVNDRTGAITAGQSGWNLGSDFTPGPGTPEESCRTQMVWRVAGVSEPATYTWSLGTSKEWGTCIKVFRPSGGTPAVDASATTDYGQGSDVNIDCGAASGVTVARNAVSIIAGGKDNRGVSGSYSSATQSYTGVLGNFGASQATGMAHRIYTAQTTISGLVVISTDGISDLSFSTHMSWLAGGDVQVPTTTASGVATKSGALTASGSPNVTGPTASGAASKIIAASGTPTVTGPTASGAATLTALEAEPGPAQVLSVTESVFTANTTSHNVSMPATVNAGDLLILAAANHCPTTSNDTQTTPTGWTQLSQVGNPSFYINAAVYAKIADGTEGGTTVDVVTSAAQTMSAHVYRISNFGGDIANDIDINSATDFNTANGTVPSVTAGWGVGANLYINFHGTSDDDIAVVSVGGEGYGNLVETRCAAGIDNSVNLASTRKIKTGPGSGSDTPTTQWLYASTEAHVGHLVVIRSAGPQVSEVTASGQAGMLRQASGTPNVTGPTASGAAALAGALTASGSPNVTGPTASGAATLTALEASGSPNVAGPTASGAASLKKAASGTPTVTGPTASGSAGMLRSASGSPNVTGPTASGTVAKIIRASGTPDVTGPTAFGLASLGGLQALGSPDVTGPTASGTVTKIIRASGTPTVEAVTAAGQAGMLRQASGSPSVEQVTASGAAAKTITASGTPNVTGPTASGQAGMLRQASGSPSVAQVTASGAAVLAGALQASGSPNVEQVTASGTVTLAALQAAGSPTVTEATASGTASLKKVASGTPTLDQVTASGAATLTALEASGSPNLDPVTAFGLATLGGLQALGSPNVEQVTASGTVTKKIAASGSPVVSQVTASGAAATITTVKQGSGSPVVQVATAAGSASLRKVASGTPTIDPVTASGTAGLRKQASGSPILEATAASGSATTAASDRRGIYSALGQFPTGSSVTITLYDPVTLAPVSLTNNVCEEIGTTGCYVWHSGKLTTQPVGYKEYVWVMTDTFTETCDIIRVNVMGVDDLFNYVVENDETFAMQLRLIRANAAGRIIEQSDGSYVIRDAVDSKDRIVGDDAVNGGRDILNTDGT